MRTTKTMQADLRTTSYRFLIAALCLLFSTVTQANTEKNDAQVPEMPQGVLQLDETVISGNQELPKVLYILPWREPQGLPEIEIQAEFTEAQVFKRLYPPAYRRELRYFDTLRGLSDDTGPDQEE
ncbi:MAG: hypothetical protein AAF541_14915 [Pseudomonadota bacterium]